MNDCNPAATPFDGGNILTKADEADCAEFNQRNFPSRHAVGGHVYLVHLTRPDLSWALSKLSQFLENTGASHVSALKM